MSSSFDQYDDDKKEDDDVTQIFMPLRSAIMQIGHSRLHGDVSMFYDRLQRVYRKVHPLSYWCKRINWMMNLVDSPSWDWKRDQLYWIIVTKKWIQDHNELRVPDIGTLVTLYDHTNKQPYQGEIVYQMSTNRVVIGCVSIRDLHLDTSSSTLPAVPLPNPIRPQDKQKRKKKKRTSSS